MEFEKIKKNKTYTYEEIKNIYEKAMGETINEPFGNIKDEELRKESEDPHLQLSTMLSGLLILHTMEDNMFEKTEEK